MSKITESARGEQCTVYAPGVYIHDDETVVFAHLNGGGMGKKHSDLFGCYACHHCHWWLDTGYVKDRYSKVNRNAIHYEAIIRTQQKLLEKGLIILK
jgi:hypothetical protein